MTALHPSNIKSLLFNIPIYQRLFTWGVEQIKELLDDLLFQYLSNKSLDYHIGVLTVKTDTSTNRLDLVDGQQRFTIMMLMGCVMQKHHKAWKDDFLNFKNNLRLDFSARPDDRKYLNDLINNEVAVGSVNETMNDGVDFIKNYLEKHTFESQCNHISKIANLEVKQATVEGFCEYTYEHLSFFLSYLPDDYNARMLNKHFETMNSTGRNLENHEILKVQLLKEVSAQEYSICVGLWNLASMMNQTICSLSNPDEKHEHIDTMAKARKSDFINDKGQEIEATDETNKVVQNEQPPTIISLLTNNSKTRSISKNNESQKELTFRPFLNFTDYLLQILYLMLDKNKKERVVYQQFFNPNNLIKTCNEHIGKEEDKIKPYDFIQAIYRYRFFFDYYILRIDGNGSYRLLSAESSEHDKLEQFEAMLYADSSRYTYYRWIPFILEYVSDEANVLDNEQILSKLKVHDSSIDEHLKAEFDNFSFGEFNNYYFRRLDYYLWEHIIIGKKVDELLPDGVCLDDAETTTINRAIKDYKFHQYNSVEHFHPRSEKEQVDIWDDDESINSFGNLALISQSFNSTQNDDSLSLKFSRVKDQIDKNKLESIKLALIYYSAHGEYKEWTKDLMKSHNRLMVDVLNNSYL